MAGHIITSLGNSLLNIDDNIRQCMKELSGNLQTMMSSETRSGNLSRDLASLRKLSEELRRRVDRGGRRNSGRDSGMSSFREDLETLSTQTEDCYFDLARYMNPSPPPDSTQNESRPELPIAKRKGKRLKSQLADSFKIFASDFTNRLGKKVKRKHGVVPRRLEFVWQRLSPEMREYYHRIAADRRGVEDPLGPACGGPSAGPSTSTDTSFNGGSTRKQSPGEYTDRAVKRKNSSPADIPPAKLCRTSELVPRSVAGRVSQNSPLAFQTLGIDMARTASSAVMTSFLTPSQNNLKSSAFTQTTTNSTGLNSAPPVGHGAGQGPPGGGLEKPGKAALDTVNPVLPDFGLTPIKQEMNTAQEPESSLDLTQILTILGIAPDASGNAPLVTPTKSLLDQISRSNFSTPEVPITPISGLTTEDLNNNVGDYCSDMAEEASRLFCMMDSSSISNLCSEEKFLPDQLSKPAIVNIEGTKSSPKRSDESDSITIDLKKPNAFSSLPPPVGLSGVQPSTAFVGADTSISSPHADSAGAGTPDTGTSVTAPSVTAPSVTAPSVTGTSVTAPSDPDPSPAPGSGYRSVDPSTDNGGDAVNIHTPKCTSDSVEHGPPNQDAVGQSPPFPVAVVNPPSLCSTPIPATPIHQTPTHHTLTSTPRLEYEVLHLTPATCAKLTPLEPKISQIDEERLREGFSTPVKVHSTPIPLQPTPLSVYSTPLQHSTPKMIDRKDLNEGSLVKFVDGVRKDGVRKRNVSGTSTSSLATIIGPLETLDENRDFEDEEVAIYKVTKYSEDSAIIDSVKQIVSHEYSSPTSVSEFDENDSFKTVNSVRSSEGGISHRGPGSNASGWRTPEIVVIENEAGSESQSPERKISDLKNYVSQICEGVINEALSAGVEEQAEDIDGEDKEAETANDAAEVIEERVLIVETNGKGAIRLVSEDVTNKGEVVCAKIDSIPTEVEDIRSEAAEMPPQEASESHNVEKTPQKSPPKPGQNLETPKSKILDDICLFETPRSSPQCVRTFDENLNLDISLFSQKKKEERLALSKAGNSTPETIESLRAEVDNLKSLTTTDHWISLRERESAPEYAMELRRRTTPKQTPERKFTPRRTPRRHSVRKI